jgi:hypothetical protein
MFEDGWRLCLKHQQRLLNVITSLNNLIMKYFTLVYCFLFLGFLAACQKDGDNVKPSSYFCAELNGRSWNGQTWAYLHGDTISFISQLYKHKIRQDWLAITYIPVRKGRIRIYKDTINFTVADTIYRTLYEDGEYPCNNYTLLGSDSINNYIEITDFNMEEKIFKGVFSATYVRDSANACGILNPDTMKFRKGKFNIKLK